MNILALSVLIMKTVANMSPFLLSKDGGTFDMIDMKELVTFINISNVLKGDCKIQFLRL